MSLLSGQIPFRSLIHMLCGEEMYQHVHVIRKHMHVLGFCQWETLTREPPKQLKLGKGMPSVSFWHRFILGRDISGDFSQIRCYMAYIAFLSDLGRMDCGAAAEGL